MELALVDDSYSLTLASSDGLGSYEVNGRADTELGTGEQLLHRSSHNMGARVPFHFQFIIFHSGSFSGISA